MEEDETTVGPREVCLCRLDGKRNGSKMMQGYEGGGGVPEEELCGLSEVPLGNDTAGAIRPLFLSGRGPALGAGSGSFYPETSFRAGSPDGSRGLSLRNWATAHRQVRHLRGTNKYQLLF